MASKLSQLRQGKPVHKIVEIRGQKFMVVIVSSDTIRQCEELVEEYANNHKDKVNERVRSQYFDTLLTYNCLRDPDDDTLETRVAESVEEVSETLDTEDIGRVMQAYGDLMVNKAPKVELLNDKQLDEIKNYLEVTPLSDLDTVSVVHLMNFHQAITSSH